MIDTDDNIALIAKYIDQSQNIVVFTGAGISTESGISDYRSQGGMWERFQPVTIQEFLDDENKRRQYWERKFELMKSMEQASPNEGHTAISQLESEGKLKGIITQNIDGLHHMAGNSDERILEIHGTNREVVCLTCQDITPWQHVYKKLNEGEDIPLCEKCQGLLKPNTISFGQNLNAEVLGQSMMWARECDFMLALGSTLIVEPAASIPRIAKQNGARLVIITLSDTPLDEVADLKIEASVGETMSKVLSQYSQLRGL